MNRVGRGFATAVLLVTALALLPGAEPSAQKSACEFDNVERIVAVGDVHGAYERFLGILKTAQVIDEQNRWIGGKTSLVQTGDVMDRGPDSKKVYEFLRRLTKEASSAGGRVHALMGNHEAMRLLGDFRYVHPGEYAAFTTPDSAEVRRVAIENSPAQHRAMLEKETPLGMVELINAFKPDQDLGRYIRSLDAVVKINGIVFLHGGISPSVAPLSCAAINTAVRREVGRDLDKTNKNLREALATKEDGPLWYRGLASEPDSFAPELAKILAAQKARAFVISHTAEPGPIRTRFDNKVFVIDTGMQEAYLPTGRASALEIKGNVFTAIYMDGRQILAGGGTP